MEKKTADYFKNVGFFILVGGLLWMFCVVISDLNALNDRYGQLPGEVFFDVCFERLPDCLMISAMSHIVMGIGKLLDNIEAPNHPVKNNISTPHIPTEFEKELNNMDIGKLRMIVHQRNVYSKDQIELIQKELLERENAELAKRNNS